MTDSPQSKNNDEEALPSSVANFEGAELTAAAEEASEQQILLKQHPRLVRTIRAVVQSEQFSGPTPSPRHLEHYEKVLPGSAAMIFHQFQENSEHQRQIEKQQQMLQGKLLDYQARDQNQNSKRDRLALHYVLILVVIGLLAALAMVYMKAQVVAGLIVGTLLVTVVGALLRQERKKSAVTEKKNSGTDVENTSGPTETEPESV